jgi:hypothetical protein
MMCHECLTYKLITFNDVELPCSPDGLRHVRQIQIARYGCCWSLKCPHLRLQRCSRSITAARPVALAQSSNVVTLMFSVEACSAKSLNVGVVVWQRKDVAITGARHAAVGWTRVPVALQLRSPHILSKLSGWLVFLAL